MNARFVTLFLILAGVLGSPSFAKPRVVSLSCAKQLGAKIVSDYSEEAYEAVLAYEKYMSDWANDFPNMDMIPLTKIKNKTDISNRTDPNGPHYGLMNAGLLTGTYDDTKVFVKKIHPVYDDSSLARQAQYTVLLDALFLGPQFIGIATDKGVPVGIITEYLEGEDFYYQALRDTNRGYRIGAFLLAVGMQPKDLQFKETKDGRLWVVDPGKYRPVQRTLRNPRTFKSAWQKVLVDSRYSAE